MFYLQIFSENLLSSSEKFYYSCQCPEGYAYENCTNPTDSGGSLDFGHTYCQRDPLAVEITSASGKLPLIFIDHAAYGRPMQPPENSSTKACRNLYAPNEDKVIN